jgi:hypothetical protein
MENERAHAKLQDLTLAIEELTAAERMERSGLLLLIRLLADQVPGYSFGLVEDTALRSIEDNYRSSTMYADAYAMLTTPRGPIVWALREVLEEDLIKTFHCEMIRLPDILPRDQVPHLTSITGVYEMASALLDDYVGEDDPCAC